MRKRTVRTFIGVLVGLLLAVSVVGIISANMQSHDTGTDTPVVEASSAASPSSTSTPTTTDGAGYTTTADQLAAVGAAANAADVLAAAQFLSADKAQDIVNRMVDSPQQQAVLNALTTSGPRVAEAWGYNSIAKANAAAVYSVQTEKYKLLQYDGTSASVALYVVTHWVTADYSEYRMPGITIVNMRSDNGNWLFVSSSSPQSSEVPSLAPNLSFAQTEDLYEPYLEGYEEFDNGQD